jgi:hypothetical protein
MAAFDFLTKLVTASLFGAPGAAKAQPKRPPPAGAKTALDAGESKPATGPTPLTGMFEHHEAWGREFDDPDYFPGGGRPGPVSPEPTPPAEEPRADPRPEKRRAPPEAKADPVGDARDVAIDAIHRVIDPTVPNHDEQVHDAADKVQRVLDLKAGAKEQQMTSDDKVTTTGTFILGGGHAGTLDAASHSSKDILGLNLVPDFINYGVDAKENLTGSDLAGGAAANLALGQRDPGERLSNAEIELGMGAIKMDSGTFVNGTPAGPVELRPTSEEAAEGWPPDAKAKVNIVITGEDGAEHIETVYSTETIDVAADLQTKKLGSEQLSEDDFQKLARWGEVKPDGTLESPALMRAEHLLSNNQMVEDKEVLVIGEGDTAALCSEAALAQGATGVSWTARPAKPPTTEPDPDNPGSERLTKFGEVEEEMRALAEAGMELPDTLRRDWMMHYRLHHDSLRSEVSELDKEIGKLQAGTGADQYGAEIERLTKLRDQKTALLEPHEATGMLGTNGFLSAAEKRVAEVLSVRPDPDGSGKVEVTEIDSGGVVTKRLVDKVVTALGNVEDATGPASMAQNVEEMEVIWGGDPPRPVGLKSVPDGVRVLGSAAWAMKDKIADPEEHAKYVSAIRSRLRDGGAMTVGTPFSLEDVAEDIEAANAGPAAGATADPGQTSGDPSQAAEDLSKDATVQDPAVATGDKQVRPPDAFDWLLEMFGAKADPDRDDPRHE